MQFSPLARDGLILFDTVRDLIDDSRMLRREVARGNLVSLRRGAFVESEVWATLSPRSRYLMRIRAAVAASHEQVTLAGASAAAVWGIPIAGDWPEDVMMLARWKGGGRSEPGVRKTSAGFGSALSETVGGFCVTSLARTVLDIARRSSFPDALGSVDWVLWHKNPQAIRVDDLVEELARMHPRSGLAHLTRVVGAATHLSDSFGESTCRGVIILLGFELPELQVVFQDAQGRIQSEFFWRSVRQVGEFDGKVKYTRNEFTHGDPVDVVWREKKREDRLRRMVSGVTRILTEDVLRPARLEALLLAAGIPRRSGGGYRATAGGVRPAGMR